MFDVQALPRLGSVHLASPRLTIARKVLDEGFEILPGPSLAAQRRMHRWPASLNMLGRPDCRGRVGTRAPPFDDKDKDDAAVFTPSSG